MAKYKMFNRELSWLSFNHRVLQECLDPTVPLYEKIKFMAIFSSNPDEFFRVRVASLRNLLNLKKRETAVLLTSALVPAGAIQTISKLSAGRARPYMESGKDNFRFLR